MKKLIYVSLYYITVLSSSNILLATNDLIDEPSLTRSSKVQIQQYPPLWLHIKVEKYSSYKASANAWVTQGESDNAGKRAVKDLSINLTFASQKKNSIENGAEIEVTDRSSEKCYKPAIAYATSKGPDGTVSVSTYFEENVE